MIKKILVCDYCHKECDPSDTESREATEWVQLGAPDEVKKHYAEIQSTLFGIFCSRACVANFMAEFGPEPVICR